VSGDITETDYKELKQSYESKLAGLTEQERHIREDLLKNAVNELKGQMAVKSICELRDIGDLTAEVIDALIEKIYVFGGSRIEIKFRFTDKTAEVEHFMVV